MDPTAAQAKVDTLTAAVQTDQTALAAAQTQLETDQNALSVAQSELGFVDKVNWLENLTPDEFTEVNGILATDAAASANPSNISLAKP